MKIKNKCSKCKKIKQIQNVRINLVSKYLLIKIPTQINMNNKTIRFKTRINVIDENNIKLSNYSFNLKSAIQYLPNTNTKNIITKGHYVCFKKNVNNNCWMKISDSSCSYHDYLPNGLENIYVILLERTI